MDFQAGLLLALSAAEMGIPMAVPGCKAWRELVDGGVGSSPRNGSRGGYFPGQAGILAANPEVGNVDPAGVAAGVQPKPGGVLGPGCFQGFSSLHGPMWGQNQGPLAMDLGVN